jgi:hypothetical protein
MIVSTYKIPVSIWLPDDAPSILTADLPSYNYILWVGLVPPHYRDVDLGCILTHDAKAAFVLEKEGPEGALLLVGYSRRIG